MFYLAAAVSDFYVPWPEVPEHKIQSRDGKMALTMENVPKCLGLLRNEWAPRAFHVSFKLETDEDLLISKAQKSIEAYGVHCVVANMLHTRSQRCVPCCPSDFLRLCLSLIAEHMPSLGPETAGCMRCAGCS